MEVRTSLIGVMTTLQISLPRLQSWAKKGSLAVLDQGLFAGTNFLVNILLARWLPLDHYGAFALAFSILLFLSGFHNALVLEPMTVLGPANPKDSLMEYLGFLLWIHWGLTLGLAILLLSIAGALSLATDSPSIVHALFALGLVLPFILLLWFFRKAFYLQQNLKGALVVNSFYSSCVIVGLMLIKSMGIAKLSNAIFVMGFASCIASVVSCCYLKPEFRKGCTDLLPNLKRVFYENWSYGRWMVAATFVHWLSGNSYYVFAAGFLGLEEAGALRALQNFVQPINNVLTALSHLFLPWASRHQAQKGFASLRMKVLEFTILIAVLAAVYFLFLSLASVSLIGLLYNGKYNAFVSLLPLIAVVPLITTPGIGYQIGLRVVQAPWAIFASNAAGAIIAVLLGILFIPFLGLKGVVLGTILNGISQIVVTLWFWKKISIKIS
jgi:O-antigen/teichoic acid export membrane protein